MGTLLRWLRPLATVAVMLAVGLALVGGGLWVGLVVVRHAVPSPAPVHCGRDAAGLPACAVSYADVTGHAEAHLQYPGAVVVHPLGGGETMTLEGPNSAFAGAVMASTASQDAVRSWYADWLAQHGWNAPSAVPRLSGETAAFSFRRGARESFILGFDDPQALSRVIGTGTVPPGTVTLFEARYFIAPFTAPSPATSAGG